MFFWIFIAAIAICTGAILIAALLRGKTGGMSPAEYDLQVYRDQLREVERDVARGVLGAEDAERVRLEVSRRVLAADAVVQGQAGDASHASGNSRIGAIVVLVALMATSAVLYLELGAPGARDLPLEARLAASDAARANRLNQLEAEAQAPAVQPVQQINDEFHEVMEQLRTTVAARPGDVRGLTLLMQNEARLGNMTAAQEAQQQIIDIKGPSATASDYSLMADLMVNAAGGYVSSDAEAVIRAALQRDPSEPLARYYLGLYLLQVDRPDGAFRTWSQLLEDSQPNAPWVNTIRAELEEVAWRAGVTNYQLPGQETGSAVSAQDIEAMVAGLNARLTTEGGSADEWAQLIRAQAVLGRVDSALIAWQQARTAFAEDEAALALFQATAAELGLTP